MPNTKLIQSSIVILYSENISSSVPPLLRYLKNIFRFIFPITILLTSFSTINTTFSLFDRPREKLFCLINARKREEFIGICTERSGTCDFEKLQISLTQGAKALLRRDG